MQIEGGGRARPAFGASDEEIIAMMNGGLLGAAVAAADRIQNITSDLSFRTHV